MIHFKNWTIQADKSVLARQFDNLTRTLTVAGDIPSGWDWDMLVRVGSAMDVLPLTATEEGLGIVLTAEQLSVAGHYRMQLRATQGDQVKHTNVINVYIPASLSADKLGPTVPKAVAERTATAIELPNGTTQIGAYAFYQFNTLTVVGFPDSLVTIGASAFQGCKNLAITTLPDSVTLIDGRAFSGCSNLALTALPKGLTKIIGYSFQECSSLALTALPDGVTSIGFQAFYKCTGLTSITLPASLATIDKTAFQSCSNLTDIYVPWAEGAIANAPWGATNATIHYNS